MVFQFSDTLNSFSDLKRPGVDVFSLPVLGIKFPTDTLYDIYFVTRGQGRLSFWVFISKEQELRRVEVVGWGFLYPSVYPLRTPLF